VTITTDGSYTVHTFTSSGAFTVPSNLTAEILVVAGGGGGSKAGGGGLIYNSSYLVNSGTISVTVGNGGAQAAQQTAGNSVQNTIVCYVNRHRWRRRYVQFYLFSKWC